MTDTCYVAGCSKPVKTSGLCSGHAERKRRGQDLTPPLKPKSANGHAKPCLGCNGYYYVSIGGKKKLQHRLIMEQHLGRKLTRQEYVHHLDGDPKNNALSNLVLSTAHEHMHKYHKKQPVMCRVKTCDRKSAECGLCAAHYRRIFKHGDPFPEVPISSNASAIRMARKAISEKRTIGEYDQFLTPWPPTTDSRPIEQ